jgi:predicted DNA-binding protein YlxM (UPF0122 family)
MDKRRLDKAVDLLLQQYNNYHGMTPEDVLCERERQADIIKMMMQLRKNLSEKQFDVLWLYTVEKQTFDTIGSKYGTSKQAIQQLFERILEKIKTHVDFLSFREMYYEGLLPRQSTIEAHGAEHKIGYPSEFLKEIAVEGQSEEPIHGRRAYKMKNTCVVPEYLANSFGDLRTCCETMCTDDFGRVICTRSKE